MDHADALKGQPGYLASHVLVERGGSASVSLAIFDSAEAVDRASAASLAAIAGPHIERFIGGAPAFKFLEVGGGSHDAT